jgi:hypothetical protein
VKKLLLVTLFFCFISLNSQILHYNSYIEIPTANFTEGLFVNLDMNFATSSASDIPFDPNIGIEHTYGRLNMVFKWYNGAVFSSDISYQILKEKENKPSLAIGVYELTYYKYISPVGSDEIYEDEYYPDRPPEIASFYGVATKKINKNFELTIGLGRGKFVGYGPRSFFPNTDVVFDEHHQNWALGLFGGIKAKLNNPFGFILEVDGRDANFALEYKTDLLKGNLYLAKIEQLIFDPAHLHCARIGLNFSYKLSSLYEK